MAKPTPTSAGWRLVPYISMAGRSEVLEWLTDLRQDDFDRWVEFEEVVKPLLEKSGPMMVGPPKWKGLGGGLFEIRWWRCRIYCSIKNPRLVMMYRGVVKRWPKFRAADEEHCERCRTDVEGPQYDQESRDYRYKAYCARRERDD